jgi:hypothetical protein
MQGRTFNYWDEQSVSMQGWTFPYWDELSVKYARVQGRSEGFSFLGPPIDPYNTQLAKKHMNYACISVRKRLLLVKAIVRPAAKY